MTKKNTKNTHTQETLKIRTNVNIECDWKQQEDWRLEKLRKKNKTLQFIYVSNVLSYHASPAESTVMNSFPRILHIHTIWMSWSYWDCYIISFWIHHLERNTRPSQGIPSRMIVSKSWDLAVLLCEIACCIPLNVRLNNDGRQPPAAASEGPVKLDHQHHLWVRSILPLITDQVRPSLLYWCLRLDLPPHSRRSIFLSLAVCI